MKTRERELNKRKSLSLLSKRFVVKENALRMGRHELLLNQLAQFFLAYEILMTSGDFVSEAVFVDGSGRADLFSLSEGVAYEVLCSETDKMLSKKDYPVPIVSFKAKKVVEDNLRKLIKEYDLKVE